jgi:hypothetical protein
MEKKQDKRLCNKESWCDLGFCVLRVEPGTHSGLIKGRSMGIQRNQRNQRHGDDQGHGNSTTTTTTTPNDKKSSTEAGSINVIPSMYLIQLIAAVSSITYLY